MTIVVKIGGSLTRGAPPRALLARLADRPGLVLVPGGGDLADRVRGLQPEWGLSDAAAHRLALLAMEQMAHAFVDLEPRLLTARSEAELAASARAGTGLWLPAAMTLGEASIRESWDVTSDSLAVWLATKIGACRLVLVKAPAVVVPPPAGSRAADVAAWSAAGLVDAAFATMAARFAGDILLVPADNGDLLDHALAPSGVGRPAGCEDAKEGRSPS